jgi:hypothetical protein
MKSQSAILLAATALSSTFGAIAAPQIAGFLRQTQSLSICLAVPNNPNNPPGMGQASTMDAALENASMLCEALNHEPIQTTVGTGLCAPNECHVGGCIAATYGIVGGNDTVFFGTGQTVSGATNASDSSCVAGADPGSCTGTINFCASEYVVKWSRFIFATNIYIFIWQRMSWFPCCCLVIRRSGHQFIRVRGQMVSFYFRN